MDREHRERRERIIDELDRVLAPFGLDAESPYDHVMANEDAREAVRRLDRAPDA